MTGDSIYYIYVHVELNTDHVFYVGKGKDNRWVKTSNRNTLWTKRVELLGGFRSFKIAEKLNEAEAILFEEFATREFITNGEAECVIKIGCCTTIIQPEIREKQRINIKKALSSPHVKAKQKIIFKTLFKNQVTFDKRSKFQKEYHNSPEVKNKMLGDSNPAKTKESRLKISENKNKFYADLKNREAVSREKSLISQCWLAESVDGEWSCCFISGVNATYITHANISNIVRSTKNNSCAGIEPTTGIKLKWKALGLYKNIKRGKKVISPTS